MPQQLDSTLHSEQNLFNLILEPIYHSVQGYAMLILLHFLFFAVLAIFLPHHFKTNWVFFSSFLLPLLFRTFFLLSCFYSISTHDLSISLVLVVRLLFAVSNIFNVSLYSWFLILFILQESQFFRIQLTSVSLYRSSSDAYQSHYRFHYLSYISVFAILGNSFFSVALNNFSVFAIL